MDNSWDVEKTWTFTQEWLDYLLLMTSYLVTIVTDHHWNLSQNARDKRTASGNVRCWYFSSWKILRGCNDIAVFLVYFYLDSLPVHVLTSSVNHDSGSSRPCFPVIYLFIFFILCKLFWLNKFSWISLSVHLRDNFILFCQLMEFFLQNRRWIVEWIWKVENRWILFRTSTASDGEARTGPQPVVPLFFLQSTIPLPSNLT